MSLKQQLSKQTHLANRFKHRVLLPVTTLWTFAPTPELLHNTVASEPTQPPLLLLVTIALPDTHGFTGEVHGPAVIHLAHSALQEQAAQLCLSWGQAILVAQQRQQAAVHPLWQHHSTSAIAAFEL